MKKWIAVILAALLLAGCGAEEHGALAETMNPGTVELTDGLEPGMVHSKEDVDEAALMELSLELLKGCFNETQNVTLSPLSVLSAMSMTANGAKGETLEQMTAVLGAGPEALGGWLAGWQDREGLHLANSVWFRDDPALEVQESFLHSCRDAFGAQVYRAVFDRATAEDINAWVREKTGGRIGSIVDEIPDEAMLYLINALAFEAEWEDPYSAGAVREGAFILEDGRTRSVTMMHSAEGAYLEGEGFTGFLRPYFSGYTFAALLPAEGTGMEQMLASLSGEALRQVLQAPRQIETYVALPKFEAEYSAELSSVLKQMGMEAAFDDSRADLSAMAVSGSNLFISRVLHKTCLSVDEAGTRGGAATAVEVAEECAPMETRTVRLDRPFVYLILDDETGFPVFLGTMMDPGESAVAGEPVGVGEHIHVASGEEETLPHEQLGYCGNILTTVSYEGKESTFMGGDSVFLTDLLIHLDYDPEKLCKCLPEITVTLESGESYGISLSGYARNSAGQAGLTEEQLTRVLEILENME